VEKRTHGQTHITTRITTRRQPDCLMPSAAYKTDEQKNPKESIKTLSHLFFKTQFSLSYVFQPRSAQLNIGVEGMER